MAGNNRTINGVSAFDTWVKNTQLIRMKTNPAPALGTGNGACDWLIAA